MIQKVNMKAEIFKTSKICIVYWYFGSYFVLLLYH